MKSIFFAAGIALAMSCNASVAADAVTSKLEFRENKNVQRWSRGTYLYVKGDTQKWRGEDEWVLTVNTDGTRTMRMISLVQETGVMWDIVYRVDQRFRPMELFTATWKDGVRTGTGMFFIDGNQSEGLVKSDHGLFTQRTAVPEYFAMVPHSMAADGWYFWNYDHKKGGVQHVTLFNPHGWGNTNGSVLARVQHEVPVEFKGREKITVPAGTFEADKWEIANGNKYTIWAHGEDQIMVKLIDHTLDWVYLLSAYEKSK